MCPFFDIVDAASGGFVAPFVTVGVLLLNRFAFWSDIPFSPNCVGTSRSRALCPSTHRKRCHVYGGYVFTTFSVAISLAWAMSVSDGLSGEIKHTFRKSWYSSSITSDRWSTLFRWIFPDLQRRSLPNTSISLILDMKVIATLVSQTWKMPEFLVGRWKRQDFIRYSAISIVRLGLKGQESLAMTLRWVLVCRLAGNSDGSHILSFDRTTSPACLLWHFDSPTILRRKIRRFSRNGSKLS